MTQPGLTRIGGSGRSSAAPPDNVPAAPSLPDGPGSVRRSPAARYPRIVLAMAAGLLASLAYPNQNLWWAAPLAVAALMVATHRTSLRMGALLGLVNAVALNLILVSWSGIYLGWLPRGALTLLLGCYGALTGLGLAGISWSRRWWRTPALAGWWVLGEAVASRFPWGGFGWTRLAFSQTDAPTLHLAAWGGAPLVSFAVAAAGALVAGAGLTVARRGRARAVVAGLVCSLAVLSLGALVPAPVAAETGGLNVLGVQGNTPERFAFNDRRRQVLDNHAAVATEAAAPIRSGRRVRPDLMVWPENSSDIDPIENPDARAVIDGAVDAVGAPALVGGLRVAGPTQVRNTSWLWQPGRGPVADYVKQMPVPFAEYVPWRGVLQRFVPMLQMAGYMVPGKRLGTFDVAGTRVGDLICFEVVSDSLVRRTVDAGAQVVVLQTNNATFGHTAESTQQLAITRLRAVEHGRAFLQISTVGVSAFVLPDGTVHDATSLYTAAAIQRDLPLRNSRTVADRVGAAAEFVLLGAGVLGFALALRGRRHSTTLDERG